MNKENIFINIYWNMSVTINCSHLSQNSLDCTINLTLSRALSNCCSTFLIETKKIWSEVFDEIFTTLSRLFQ